MRKLERFRMVALLVLALFIATIAFPLASMASVKGRKNTAIGLTAGAVYSAIRGKTGAAIALGAGAAYAWKRHNDEKKELSYRRGYYRGHHYGFSHSRYYRSSHYRK